MKDRGVSLLLVVSDDYHQSEYVGDFFKSRAYISGFTGSAGTLVVTDTDAALFTDGRYHIQAERQLSGSEIILMRSGTEGVPTPLDYIVSTVKERNYKAMAFDGKCVSSDLAEKLIGKLPSDVKVVTDTDFPDLIWKDRPSLPSSEIWRLDTQYSGKTHAEKLSDVRSEMKNKGCDALVISSLCDIAWLYSLRGGDVFHTPVFLSFCIITESCDKLFVNESSVANVREMLDDHVTVLPYGEFFDALKKLSGNVMTDKASVSHAIVSALSHCEITDCKSPTLLMKAVKNETELKNLRKAHIADGLALTKMMLELKFGGREWDELSVEKYLVALRRESADRVGVTYLDESFGAICAFGANAAMMHYSAKPESFASVDKNAPVPMLLIDSGGQYLEGTTDITRTFVLGNISDEIKLHYTKTCVGNLRLANLTFLEGISGKALDIVCREPLWEHGIDYRCGTGHGVGYLLSVHEGPNSFHWGRPEAKLSKGMVTTDEPGVYVAGSHGIRIENELVCTEKYKNEYGNFLGFENITYCPIDLDGIDPSHMDESDIVKLNEYHKNVFETLSPYVCSCDREKLLYLTRPISKTNS